MSRRFDRRGKDPSSDKDELSDEELLLQRGQELPDREAMSTIDADVAIPVNPALAADVLSGTAEGDDSEDDDAEGDTPKGDEAGERD